MVAIDGGKWGGDEQAMACDILRDEREVAVFRGRVWSLVEMLTDGVCFLDRDDARVSEKSCCFL